MGASQYRRSTFYQDSYQQDRGLTFNYKLYLYGGNIDINTKWRKGQLFSKETYLNRQTSALSSRRAANLQL
jgi:hypothetical protein